MGGIFVVGIGFGHTVSAKNLTLKSVLELIKLLMLAFKSVMSIFSTNLGVL